MDAGTCASVEAGVGAGASVADATRSDTRTDLDESPYHLYNPAAVVLPACSEIIQLPVDESVSGAYDGLSAEEQETPHSGSVHAELVGSAGVSAALFC